MIEDQRSGLLVPAGDVAAFAAAIDRLVQDEDLRRCLGAPARNAPRSSAWSEWSAAPKRSMTTSWVAGHWFRSSLLKPHIPGPARLAFPRLPGPRAATFRPSWERPRAVHLHSGVQRSADHRRPALAYSQSPARLFARVRDRRLRRRQHRRDGRDCAIWRRSPSACWAASASRLCWRIGRTRRAVVAKTRYPRRDAMLVMQADFTDQPEHIRSSFAGSKVAPTSSSVSARRCPTHP